MIAQPLTDTPRFAPAMAQAGDWLLSFGGGDGKPGPVRSGKRWERVCGGHRWQLWQTATDENWRGMPVLHIPGEEWRAWLFGELYGRSTADPAAAVTAVLAGRAEPGTLNGHFHLLAYRSITDEWHIWTNRLATLHAYVGNGERRAMGSFAPAVAAAAGGRDLDWEGLTSFFALGFFAGDRTHLEGIRTLRPATHYCFDACGRLVATERYWRWRHAPDTGRNYEATLAEFAGLFDEVTHDLTARGRIALPISGGLDSRSTIASIPAGDARADRLWSYSYGYGQASVETQIAARVARARGLAFDAFAIRPYLFQRLPVVLASIEGFQDVTQSRQASVIDELRSRADFVIAAHWGDVFLDSMGVASSRVNDEPAATHDLVAAALRKFRKAGGAWLLENLSRSHLNDRGPEALLRHNLAAELARIDPVADPDFAVKVLKSEQWSARWTTASLRMFQPAAFPRLPFYDTRLIDFFLTVPTEYVRDRRLQLDYLRRYAPDLARVPWQVTGRNLYHTGSHSMLHLATRGARKVHQRLTGGKTLERNWEVQFLNREGRAGLREWLLSPGLRLHNYVAPSAVAGLLDAFNRQPYVDKRGYTVSMLLTFSAWLELQAPDGVT